MSTGVVLSQPHHRRHQANLCRYASRQTLIVQIPAIMPNATSHTTTSTPVCINQPLSRHSRFALSFRVFICGVHCGLKHPPSSSREWEGRAQGGTGRRASQAGLVLAAALDRHGVHKTQERVVHEHQPQPQRRTRRAHTEARHDGSG